MNVYYKVFRPDATTQWRLVVSKSLLLVVAVLAASVASQKPATILFMVAWAFSLAGAAFFPALILGVFWKRATPAGAVSGMVIGLLVTLYYMVRVHFDAIPWLGRMQRSPAQENAQGFSARLPCTSECAHNNPQKPGGCQAIGNGPTSTG